MSNNKKLNNLLFLLLTLFVLDFYGFRYIEVGSFLDGFGKIYILLFSIISIFYSFYIKINLFERGIKIILISMFISTFMANIYWEQNWLDSIRITLPYMLFSYVFYLQRINFNIYTIEKVLLFFGVLYIFIYFVQLIYPENVLFGNREIKEARGTLRLIIPGYAFYIISTFIALNKFTDREIRHQVFYGIILVLGIIVTILQVTRQNMAAIAFVLAFHFVRNTPFTKKIIFLFVVGTFGLYFSFVENPIFDAIVQTTKEDTDDTENNVRIIAATYFVTDYSPSVINKIFGNGVSQGTLSEFGRHDIYLIEELRIDKNDVGFFGFYAMFGLLGIIGYLSIWVKSVRYPSDTKFYYLRYFIWYIFLTAFTSYSMIKIDMFFVTTLVLYMYQKVHQEDKTKFFDKY